MKEQDFSILCNGKDALIVGGSNGIGLTISLLLSKFCHVTIIDKVEPNYNLPENISYIKFDLLSTDYSIFDQFKNIDKLIITAGFGKLALFEDYSEDLIVNMMNVNATSVIRIIHHFYKKLLSKEDFYCGVMVSIAGFMSSPFFAVYGASKAALKIFIESVNVELLKSGTTNRILNVSPGSLKGTAFYGGVNDISQIQPFAESFIENMLKKNDLFIPQYEEIFKNVLERYHSDFRAEGIHSYEYKINSGRLNLDSKK